MAIFFRSEYHVVGTLNLCRKTPETLEKGSGWYYYTVPRKPPKCEINWTFSERCSQSTFWMFSQDSTGWSDQFDSFLDVSGVSQHKFRVSTIGFFRSEKYGHILTFWPYYDSLAIFKAISDSLILWKWNFWLLILNITIKPHHNPHVHHYKSWFYLFQHTLMPK